MLAIAPEFAPNSFVPQDSIPESLAETSTVASLRASSPLDEKNMGKIEIDYVDRKKKKKSGAWKRLLCLK